MGAQSFSHWATGEVPFLSFLRLTYALFWGENIAWSTDKIKNKYRKAFGEEKFNNLMLMHEADKQGKDMTKRLKLDGGDDDEAV